MSEQPEALRLAEAMLNYWDERGPDAEAVAAELRRQHDRIETLEAALRQAAEALETVVVDAKTTPNAYEATRQAISAAKQALGEKK